MAKKETIKSLHGNEIFKKQIKLKERERQCKRRKNLQKICLSNKDTKSLKNKKCTWEEEK